MVLQDMRHCSDHCMDDFERWTCGYKKWWRPHKRKCYAGCFFGTPWQHEILPEDFIKYKD